jgi:hypothetical protein
MPRGLIGSGNHVVGSGEFVGHIRWILSIERVAGAAVLMSDTL